MKDAADMSEQEVREALREQYHPLIFDALTSATDLQNTLAPDGGAIAERGADQVSTAMPDMAGAPVEQALLVMTRTADANASMMLATAKDEDDVRGFMRGSALHPFLFGFFLGRSVAERAGG